MFLRFLNSNRYKITKITFSVFLIVGILNWTFGPSVLTYAEDELPPADPAPTETVAEEPAPEPAVIEEILQEPSEEPANEGSAVVDTGDAVSSADVINGVNSNEINSEGEIIVGSGSLGDDHLDLQNIFSTTTPTTASTTPNNASSTPCCTASTTIINQNEATTTNDVIVSASTGGNTASSTATSTIITGDAMAGANVVNVVNTNIVESNYLLLVFNNFGDWGGDLIFPNGDFFGNFLSLFNPNCNCGGDTNISNFNSADISNNINTSADTGNNKASGDSSINTGNALASSNTYNLVNANVYGDSSFYLLVKVFGDWSGSIFNLPAGMAWQNTPEGLVLYNENNNPFENNSGGNSGNLTINNENNASVENNIDVSASTGNNNATGTDSVIQTGNAYAGSNTVNIVNTNIISSNWAAALVNVFGNWSGNISFGQPDLWVGTIASVEGEALAGSSVTFTTTVKNNGDAPASDINVLSALKTSNFRFAQSYSGHHLYHIDSLMPGESEEFTYWGMTEKFVPDNRPPVVIETSVSSLETDGNMDDNLDTLTFNIANNPWAGILTQNSFSSSYSDLEVIKTHTIPSSIGVEGEKIVPFGGSVDYTIVIKNHGGSAFNGVLYDQLLDQNGEEVSSQYWELGEILTGEEITVTYTTEFTEQSLPGTYTNFAWVEAVDGDMSYGGALADKADSNVASDSITLAEKQVAPPSAPEPEPVGEVLGMFTETAPIVEEEQFVEFLGGFCAEEIETKGPGTLSFAQSLLLGLSLILIIQKRKDLPTNLFLI